MKRMSRKSGKKNRENQGGAGKDGSPVLYASLSAALTLAGVLCLPQILLQEGRGLGFSNSGLSVLVFLLALPVIHRALWKDRVLRQQPALTLSLAFFFVLACGLGSRLETEGYVAWNDFRLWTALPFLTVFVALLLGELWTLPERWEKTHEKSSGSDAGPLVRRWEGLPGKTRLLLVFLLFMAVWGIVLLGVYPGFFVYDAQEEFNQVAQRSFTTHHPLSHVLLLGGIVCAGNKLFGSYNAGIACYMLVQMGLLAACFTYCVSWLERKAAPRWLRAAGVVYFAFFPVIQMYVLCSAKDTLYSAGMLLVIVLLADLAEEKRAFFSGFRPVLLSGSLLCMAAMRHNGFYILLLLIPVLAVWGGKRGLLVGGGALAAYLAVTVGLQTVLQAENTENQELLTVPIQQLARTYALAPENFTEEEEETLLLFLPEEALARYTPKLSDSVKIDFNNEAYGADPASFWRLWASVGAKSPAVYLNAWLLTSYGFWYPEAVIDVYRGNTVFTFTYGDSSYFGYETELPGVRESRIPWLDSFFRSLSLELSWQKLPVVSMLFSPGFLFWVYAAGLGYVVRQKRKGAAAAFLPAGLNWLTVLLGPTFLVRYVLIAWFALPVLCFVVTEGKLCYTNTKTVKGTKLH